MLNELIEVSNENVKENFGRNTLFSLVDMGEYEVDRVNSYAGFEAEQEVEGNMIVRHDELFGAEAFKEITKVNLPIEIASFFSENSCFFTLQYPVFANYLSDDWTYFSGDIVHPNRMARVVVNKWDYICESYHRRGFYSFKKDRMIPVVYMGEGGYLTYYYGKKKAKGIYYFDEKIADTYVEMIKRLSIHPNYYLSEAYSDSYGDRFKYKSFDKNSEIPEELFNFK